MKKIKAVKTYRQSTGGKIVRKMQAKLNSEIQFSEGLVKEESWNALSIEQQNEVKLEAIETLKKVHEWTRHGDFKASPFLAGTITILIFLIREILEHRTVLSSNHLLSFIVFVMVISLIISTGFFITSIQPRLSKLDNKLFRVDEPTGTDTIIFFAHIAQHKSEEAFIADFCQRARGYELLSQYLNQIHVSSIICKDKYKRCGWGVQFLAVGMLAAMICGLLIYCEPIIN